MANRSNGKQQASTAQASSNAPSPSTTERDDGASSSGSRGATGAHRKELLAANRELRAKLEELTRVNNELVSRVEPAEKQTESALRNLEDLYAALFNSIDQGFCTLEVAFDENSKPVDYRFLQVSPSFERQTGIKIGAERGMREIGSEQDEFWLEIYGQVALTREPARFEYFSTPLGRWWAVYAFGVDDPQLRRVGVLFTDITERKRAEEAVRASEQRLQKMVNVEGVGVLTFNHEGTILSANEAFLHMVGYSRDEFEARTFVWQDFTPTEYSEESLRQFESALKTGRAGPYEKEYVRKDGSRIWMMFVGADLGDGTVAEYAIDISARKRAEEALQKSEERPALLLKLSDALRSTTDPVAIEETVTRLTMEHFASDRCYYSTIEGDYFIIRRDAMREGLPSVVGTYPLGSFPLFKRVIEEGRPLVVHDAYTSEILDEELRELCLQLQVISFVNVPVLRDGKVVAVLCLVQSAPRDWLGAEVDLAAETAERTWVAVERARAEEALTRSEEKYRALFDSIDEGFAIEELFYDEEGNIDNIVFREVNRAYERQSGLADVVGRSVKELLPNLEQHWKDVFANLVKTGKPVRVINYAKDVGRWFDTYLTLLPGSNKYVAVVFNDITDRKRREANAAFLDEVSRNLDHAASIEETMLSLGARIGEYFDVARCSFAEINRDAGEVAVTNAWSREDGVDPAGYHVVALRDYVSDELYEAALAGEIMVVRDTTTDLRTGAQAYAARNARSSLTVPFLSGGEWRATLSIADTRPRDWREDEIELMRELTVRVWTRLQRVRAEQALRESEERFRALVSQAAVGFAQTARGRFTYVNDRFCEITGRSREELMGQTVGSITHPDEAERDMGLLNHMYETGEPYTVDKRYVRPDGSISWVLNSVTPVRDLAGKIIGGFAAAVDVTDRVRTEEALRMVQEGLEKRVEERTVELAEANDRLRHLSRRVLDVQEEERRHLARELHDEIGQYLTGLRFMLEKSKSEFAHPGDEGDSHAPPDPLDPHGTEAQLALSLGVLSDLTERVRNLALDLRPIMLDDMGLLPALLWYVQRYQSQTGIEVEFHHIGLKVRLPFEVETAVYRVVQEALTNVARHSGAGHVTLQVFSDGKVTVVIEDSGSGFDVEQTIARHTSTGLSAMRERVELVGGEFTVESSPGQGTTIIVDIPVVPEDAE